MIKRYINFVKENAVEVAPTRVKPATTPSTPTRRSPLRKDKPAIKIKPKAEDVAQKFLELTKDNKEIQSLLKKKYQ